MISNLEVKGMPKKPQELSTAKQVNDFFVKNPKLKVALDTFNISYSTYLRATENRYTIQTSNSTSADKNEPGNL
jgi:hypothetical protein